MTHAGYLSFEESLCHQVPMVATPICYDQFDNAAEIESLGIGKSIKFTEITLENMTEALSQILNNPKFKETAKKIGSALSPWKEMVDPVSRREKISTSCPYQFPLHRAVWWVEHVTENPGVWTLKNFYGKIPSSIMDGTNK